MAEKVAGQPDIQPEFAFTEEQDQLRAAVRKFCRENFDEQTVRRLMLSDSPFDAKVWARLGTELGVLGLSVPEADGGVGGTLVDQAVAVEELGASLACGPMFGTVFLAIPALVSAPAGQVRNELLVELVEGRRTAAVAVTAGVATSDVAVSVTAADGALTGTIERVVDASAADILLVAASGAEGVALYAVEASAPEVQRRPLSTLDLTRPQATVVLTGAPGRLIAGPPDAARVIERALQVGSALLAVEQVGAGQHLLDLSVDYVKSRRQFGRPIGSFQAVKHRLADLLIDFTHARSTAYHAVWALAYASDDPALAVSIAQATASTAFSRIAAGAIQVHGGIGFTWEHQAHLYFKRAACDAALLGTAEQHRCRIAELVLDTLDASVVEEVLQVATGSTS